MDVGKGAGLEVERGAGVVGMLGGFSVGGNLFPIGAAEAAAAALAAIGGAAEDMVENGVFGVPIGVGGWRGRCGV